MSQRPPSAWKVSSWADSRGMDSNDLGGPACHCIICSVAVQNAAATPAQLLELCCRAGWRRLHVDAGGCSSHSHSADAPC